jgi:hypothetical protein
MSTDSMRALAPERRIPPISPEIQRNFAASKTIFNGWGQLLYLSGV